MKYIKFSSKGKVKVKVHFWDGNKSQNFEVVQIYLDNFDSTHGRPSQSSPKGFVPRQQRPHESGVIAIDCFVSNNFTFHRMVPKMKQFLKENTSIPQHIIAQVVEPDSDKVSHKKLNLGTALILSNSDRIKIMSGSENILLRKWDLLLENTIFGYAVSGKVPEKLVSGTYDLQAGMVTPIIVNNAVVRPDSKENEYFQGYQATLSHDYENLDNMVRLLWEKELSLGVLKGEVHTDDEKARKIFQEGVSLIKI